MSDLAFFQKHGVHCVVCSPVHSGKPSLSLSSVWSQILEIFIQVTWSSNKSKAFNTSRSFSSTEVICSVQILFRCNAISGAINHCYIIIKVISYNRWKVIVGNTDQETRLNIIRSFKSPLLYTVTPQHTEQSEQHKWLRIRFCNVGETDLHFCHPPSLFSICMDSYSMNVFANKITATISDFLRMINISLPCYCKSSIKWEYIFIRITGSFYCNIPIIQFVSV